MPMRTMRSISTRLALGLVAVGLVAAGEGPAPAEPIDGPLAQCLACHRPGNPAEAVPLIAGQREGYLRNQLRAFRDRHRDGFPMPAFAVDLDELAVAAYAERLATLPWEAGRPPRVSEAALAAGALAFERHDCGSCHGADYLGADEIPRLAGQNRVYLARQIEAFGREGRHHPPVGTGARMYHLDAEEIAAIAAWLASLRPAAAPMAGD